MSRADPCLQHFAGNAGTQEKRYPRKMWLKADELEKVGFGSIGSNCLVDSRAMIIGPEKIFIGHNVRIDAFSTVSSQGGFVKVGDHVHVASSVVVYGAGGVTLATGSGLASGVKVLSSTDDYIWGNLTNPTMPDDLRGVSGAPIVLLEHAVVGANSVILPGSTIGFGAAVGALSLVRGKVEDYQIVAGNPMKVLGKRNSKLLQAKHLDFLERFANREI